MATTSPDNLRTPDAGDQYALVQDLGRLADDTQDALTDIRTSVTSQSRQYRGLAAAKASVTGMVFGDTYQETDGSKLAWRYDGTGWVEQLGVIDLLPSGTQSLSGGNDFTSWAAPGSGGSVLPGASFFSYASGAITVLRTGNYRILARLAVSNANGQATAIYLTLNGNTSLPISQDTVQTHYSYGSMAKMDVGFISLTANDVLRVRVQAASTTLTYGGSSRAQGEFYVEYLGS